MNSWYRYSRWLLIFTAVHGCGNSPAQNVRRIFERYMEASQAHDLSALAELTADDVVWQLGTQTLIGKEQALRPHLQDSLLNAIFDVRNVVVRGDTVEFTLVERNDAFEIHGIDSVVHYPRFVFKQGQVVRKEPSRRSQTYEQAGQTGSAQAFRMWVRRVHPEALAIILDSSGAPTWSREALTLSRSLLNEWVRLGKPGAD